MYGIPQKVQDALEIPEWKESCTRRDQGSSKTNKNRRGKWWSYQKEKVQWDASINNKV